MNRVRGRNTATAATAGNVAAALWNPHATLACTVYEIAMFATTAPAAGSSIVIQRLSARGTSSASVTPTISNDTQGGAVPTTGAILDTGYSVQPTVVATSVTNGLWEFMFPAVIGSGFVQPFPEGLRVPAGAGLGIVVAQAVIVPVCTIGIAFDE
jgi:hypothetical protein